MDALVEIIEAIFGADPPSVMLDPVEADDEFDPETNWRIVHWHWWADWNLISIVVLVLIGVAMFLSSNNWIERMAQ